MSVSPAEYAICKCMDDLFIHLFICLFIVKHGNKKKSNTDNYWELFLLGGEGVASFSWKKIRDLNKLLDR